jgi:hypothetical protein
VLVVEHPGREVVELGQVDRQQVVGHRDRPVADAAGGGVDLVDDGEGLAPVALAAEQPIAQPRRDAALAEAA